MANPEHLDWLREGTSSWNKRQVISADLSGENLSNHLGSAENESIRHHLVDLSDIFLPNANLSNTTLERADLSRGCFSTANFTNAELKCSNFSDSNCNGTKFHGANLTSTTFSGTGIFETDFSTAHFNESHLRDAIFINCSFNKAQFESTDLNGTRFYGCTLDQARLDRTDLVGTEFTESRPWTAQLFNPSIDETFGTFSFQKERISCIEDLLDACRQLRMTYGENSTLYFRGESLKFKELCPSVMRMRGNERKLRPIEASILNELMTRQPEGFYGVDTALAQWVFAQHHGLPTRLLDVTRNPLVALFNSCKDEKKGDGFLHIFVVPNSLIKPFNSDAVRIICNFAKLPRSEQNLLLGKNERDAKGDIPPSRPKGFGRHRNVFCQARERLYFLIRQESPFFQEKIDWRDLFRVFVVEPQRMFDRIRAQSGAFLISAFHERFEREEILKWNKDTPIYAHHTIAIPQAEKASILDELELLNVTDEMLLPSVDGAARAIIDRHEDGKYE